MNSGCRPLTKEESELMLANFENKRDFTLFLLGLRTGFRISELLSIKKIDLFEYCGAQKSSITVSKSKTKGKVASRTIPLSKDTLGALKTYVSSLPASQIYLFESREGYRLSRIQAWRIITNASRSLKLKGKIATHSMRKVFCRNVYEALGKDLIKTRVATGHANLNNLIHYLQVDETEINNVIRGI